MNHEDVVSLAALHGFLAKVTRSSPGGAMVQVVAFEPDVDVLLDVLGIEGPPPDVISITLPTL